MQLVILIILLVIMMSARWVKPGGITKMSVQLMVVAPYSVI